ncbi:MAG TPA: TrpB-like pyridoxal phosphate-dependent enzyme [bacterium (Candidatus Stahlbacteria)]|nr:TrpB-like pyridoxal phosphate-dependent enzyme [Candidatus Stahlbacteria bacterium]
MEPRYVNLKPEELPKRWYNILPDLPEPLPPPRDPEDGQSRLANLNKIIIGECLKQEMSEERWIEIPEELQEIYILSGRPRPLFRARNLERALDTPAHLYYKAEFYSPTGSHKVNTALAQCYYARKEGYERVTTETGAGQWGTALAYGASLFGLKCTIFWVRAVYNWKSDRRTLMQLFGAEVNASPSPKTRAGKALYDRNPEHPGSLAIAISEGIEDALGDDKAIYCLGSVLNHVLTHQTIIGLETQKQFEIFGEYPDIMISCLGGGSNFGGFVLPFVGETLRNERKISFIAAQSRVAPNLQGEYRFDFADHAEQTPLLKMYTLGHQFEMDPIKADGLRYHGAAPIISLLRHHGYIDTIAYPPDEKYVFDRAKLFVQSEGYLPAPESAYSIACAIDEALKCRDRDEKKVIGFNISGHGFLDIPGYREVLKI